MEWAWLTGWQDFLKGLGAAGLLIYWLMRDGEKVRRERDTALANERAARQREVEAEARFSASLLASMKDSNAEALANASASQSTAAAMQASADAMGDLTVAIREIGDRIPERRRPA